MKIENGQIIYDLNDAVYFHVDLDNDLSICYPNNDVIIIEENAKEQKKEIDKQINKKDFFITNNSSVFINEILYIEHIEEDLEHTIGIKSTKITDYKKEEIEGIKKIINKDKFYIAEDFSVQVDKIESLSLNTEEGYLCVLFEEEDSYNLIIYNNPEEHKRNIENFHMNRKVKNF